LILFAFVLPLAAQQSAAQPAAQAEPQADAPQTAASENKTEKQNQEAEKQNREPAAAELAVFDERAAAAVLGTIRDGLEGRSARRLLSAFDAGKMDGYRSFEDQVDAYFASYESIRVTLRILQVSQENDRGIILAEFQLENDPRDGERLSRRQGQLRFVLERGPKGWKIVDLDPRAFFS
jgi:ketosteroid isomerase-like protein